MQQADAYQFLASDLDMLLATPYAELKTSIGERYESVRDAADGTRFGVEIDVCWWSQEAGEVLLDGRAFAVGTGPLRRIDRRVVVRPNGSTFSPS